MPHAPCARGRARRCCTHQSRYSRARPWHRASCPLPHRKQRVQAALVSPGMGACGPLWLLAEYRVPSTEYRVVGGGMISSQVYIIQVSANSVLGTRYLVLGTKQKASPTRGTVFAVRPNPSRGGWV